MKTEIGLVYAGDPLGFFAWSQDRQIRALAWAHARRAGADDSSTAPLTLRGLMRAVPEIVERLAHTLAQLLPRRR